MRRLRSGLQAYRPEIDDRASRDASPAPRRAVPRRPPEPGRRGSPGVGARPGGRADERQRAGLRWHLDRLEARRRRADRRLARLIRRGGSPAGAALSPPARALSACASSGILPGAGTKRRRSSAAASASSAATSNGASARSAVCATSAWRTTRPDRGQAAALPARALPDRGRRGRAAHRTAASPPGPPRRAARQPDAPRRGSPGSWRPVVGSTPAGSTRRSSPLRTARLRAEDPRPGPARADRAAGAARGRSVRPSAHRLARRRRPTTSSRPWRLIGRQIAHRPACVEEIQRRFLLRRVPATAQAFALQEIDQGWLPGTRVVERIRALRRDDLPVTYRTTKWATGGGAYLARRGCASRPCSRRSGR